MGSFIPHRLPQISSILLLKKKKETATKASLPLNYGHSESPTEATHCLRRPQGPGSPLACLEESRYSHTSVLILPKSTTEERLNSASRQEERAEASQGNQEPSVTSQSSSLYGLLRGKRGLWKGHTHDPGFGFTDKWLPVIFQDSRRFIKLLDEVLLGGM